jgi:hypothetical protein
MMEIPMPDIAPLAFHPLTFVAEHDGVLVGRQDTESYAVLPEDGAQLLHRLVDGMPVAEAVSWYQATYAEPVDIADFLLTLRELGFVREDGEPPAAPQRVRFQRLGSLAFSPPLWICYLGLVVACVVVMSRQPRLLPRPGNIFFIRSLIAVQLAVFATQMPALAWHEWFHVLAGRRLGLPTRLTVGRRLFFVVLETRLNALLGVPPRRRYLPFLAGMLADLVLFSGLTLVAAADRSGPLAWAGRLALAAAYVTLLRLAWQLCVFLRTDSYYVLTTALGCTDLAGAAAAYLRSLADRTGLWRGGPRPDTEFSARDRALAPAFGLVTVVGVTAMFALAGIAIAPAIVEFFTRLGQGLASGRVGASFWDSTGSLVITVTQLAVLPLLVGRRARKQRRNKPQTKEALT